MSEEERPLLKPEEFDLLDDDGHAKTYILSNFDAVTGRQIITQYPMTGLPNIGNYAENEKLMFKLMSFVAVVTSDGRQLRLSTPALVMNHVPNAEMLMKLEMKMMEKNCSFFRDGRSLDLLDTIAQIVSKKIFELLTPLSESSSPPDVRPSTN
jgi:hypothetical protein